MPPHISFHTVLMRVHRIVSFYLLLFYIAWLESQNIFSYIEDFTLDECTAWFVWFGVSSLCVISGRQSMVVKYTLSSSTIKWSISLHIQFSIQFNSTLYTFIVARISIHIWKSSFQSKGQPSMNLDHHVGPFLHIKLHFIQSKFLTSLLIIQPISISFHSRVDLNWIV